MSCKVASLVPNAVWEGAVGYVHTRRYGGIACRAYYGKRSFS
ncbi:hypothetical protein AWB79_04515 [Caballeronia hypogeia]|uniref:Uncharacterized protein n=1 Tax=Caballeronia hypogeia TaxID=1777140 RepID=A0A158C0E8_9BURK|nr:hypothetical protein AWB79_04515 [Caballeronia hypogeia]